MATTNNHRDVYIGLIERQPRINDRYSGVKRLDSEAGTGTFSLVFKAIDEHSKSSVALKFYNPLQEADIYRKECFIRESDILKRLQGQRDMLQLVESLTTIQINIQVVPGKELPLPLSYIATELADSNLTNYIYSDSGSTVKHLYYFRALCRGVQRMHSQHICHRDIKPDNVFMMDSGVLKLGDFGSARVAGASPLSSAYIGWRGDCKYTAPEQCVCMREEPELFEIGDMYSLGAILFEMFTKQSLFQLVMDYGFHSELARHFTLMPPDQRESMFKQLLPSIVKTRRLPNIYDFSAPIPECIKIRLDRLYKELACLDYSCRAHDFSHIFHEINMCTSVLEKEELYKKWIAFNRIRQEYFKAKKRA